MITSPIPQSCRVNRLQHSYHLLSNHRLLAIAALIAANVVWGGSPAASKAALANLGPLSIGVGRDGLAVLVFALLLAMRGERFATGRMPAALGLFGIALFAAFQNYGLFFADATATSLIGGAKPVLIAVLAVPLLHERLRVSQLGGLLVSMSGVGVIVLIGSERTPEAALGNLLPLASAVCFAFYAVLSRRAFGGEGSLVIIAGATRYGFLFLLPCAALELVVTGTPTVTVPDTLLLLYLGVGCSALGFVLCGYGYTHLTAAQAAPFSNLKLVSGVALAVTLLGEPLTVSRICGAVLVLLGVAMATTPVFTPAVWMRCVSTKCDMLPNSGRRAVSGTAPNSAPKPKAVVS